MQTTSEGLLVKPPTYRLRIPGPTPVPERVRGALAEPALNHRGPEFRTILREAEDLAKGIFQTQGDVLFFAGSGTAGMEAALVNVVAPGERVLVLINGQFGERFKSIAERVGAQVDTLEVEWGQSVNPEAVARQVRERDYRAVLVTHNESSTGAVNDLAALGAIVRDRSTLLVVDAVSSLGAIDLEMDRWGLDVVISASQKALMSPPGVTLVAISRKAWDVVNRETAVPRFFWDFRKAKASLEKGETPFTAPTALVMALREAMRMIHEEGMPQVLARHARLAAALRAGCTAIGLPVFTTAPTVSNAVTALRVPEGMDGAAVVRHMYERYHTAIGGSRNKLSGRVVRIGTMGHVDAADILTDLHFLERTLQDLGRPVEVGAGVAAASAVLAR